MSKKKAKEKAVAQPAAKKADTPKIAASPVPRANVKAPAEPSKFTGEAARVFRNISGKPAQKW